MSFETRQVDVCQLYFVGCLADTISVTFRIKGCIHGGKMTY